MFTVGGGVCVCVWAVMHTKSVPISKIKQISENKGHYLVIISLFY